MGLREFWSRALVYFGIAEEEEYWDEESFSAVEELERSYSQRPNVRRLPRPQDHFSVGESDDLDGGYGYSASRETSRRADTSRRSRPSRRVSPNLVPVPEASARVHLVVPKNFNDAQAVADRFKRQMPVIVNLQSVEPELSKRLIDFASGLAYALDGTMQRVADKVFLLTPPNVEVSAEERARISDTSFFNQT